jgi:hypothetical protein
MSFFRYDKYWEGELKLTPLVKVLQERELGKHRFGPLNIRSNYHAPVERNNFGVYDTTFSTKGGRQNYNCRLTRVCFTVCSNRMRSKIGFTEALLNTLR